MEIGLLTERTYRIYKAIYKTLQAEDSVDDFFVASRVPLDTDVANDPITRERVKKLLDKDKIATKWLAIGWTSIIVIFVLNHLHWINSIIGH